MKNDAMTTNSTRLGRRWPSWLLFALPVVVIVIFMQVQVSIGQSSTNTPTTYPTNYPPEKRTVEASAQQTLQAGALTPWPTDYIFSFPPATNAPFPFPTPVGTIAGVGLITTKLGSPVSPASFSASNAWMETTSSGRIVAYAGAYASDSTQGVIIVSERAGTIRNWFPTPVKAGKLTITGAQGERLILGSDNGTTFYFDVPGRMFVSSLTVVVSTVTPVPTFTSAPTITPRFTDDAPDDPWYGFQNSLVNTDLNYKINSGADVDWFRFHTDYAGTVQVSLTNLPANYDLYVYSATDTQLRVSSTNTGMTSEQVTLTNAPANDYYVRVVGVSGAFNATTPYTLRFSTPVNVNINFQPASAPADYLVDSGAVYGNRGNGYTFLRVL
jgi:hypothetical protein